MQIGRPLNDTCNQHHPGRHEGSSAAHAPAAGVSQLSGCFFDTFGLAPWSSGDPHAIPGPLLRPTGMPIIDPPAHTGGSSAWRHREQARKARGARTHYFRVVALPSLRRQGLLHRAAWGRSAREAGGSCPLPPLRPPPSRGGLHVTLLARVRDHLVERAQDFVGLARGQPTHGGALGCGGPGCLGPGGVRRGAA